MQLIRICIREIGVNNSLTSPRLFTNNSCATCGQVMSFSCCLCRLSVEDSHRKRKRFHGHGCDIARLVICSLSSVALNYKEFKDPNTLLCLSCDKLLRDLQTAETKVNNIRQQITEKLQRLQADNHGFAPGIPNKRQRIDCDNLEVPEELAEVERIAGPSSINDLTQSDNVRGSEESLESNTNVHSRTLSQRYLVHQ